MSVWERISGPFYEIVEGVLQLLGRGDPAAREAAIFTAALIALSAKMAKADGVVTTDEVAAFHRICEVGAGEEERVRRLFDLAKRTTMGFDGYARQIAGLYAERPAGLEHVLDGLFSIATADGWVHERELGYLEDVSQALGLGEAEFARVRARHVHVETDPYAVLGIERGANERELRQRYRALVVDNHPDRLVSRGLPPEFLKLANDRLASINAAYEAIERERAR